MEYESESMRELIENTEMFFELENVVCQINRMNLMCRSCYIQNVLICIIYQNCVKLWVFIYFLLFEWGKYNQD